MSFQSATIKEAIGEIQSNQYLFPDFQREYTWEPEQVERLFDSLMRGYPTGSMLFWRVTSVNKDKWKFYQFLQYYREAYHTHNEPIIPNGKDEFYAILDGQQRLTSIYLALCGHYDIHRKYQSWVDEDDKFHICDFYFNLTQKEKPKNADITYEFLWLNRKNTEEKAIYQDEHSQKWFKCSHLFNINDFYDFKKDNNLLKEEEIRLDKFQNLIFNTPDTSKIYYYLIKGDEIDIATDIFIRINSGGTKLEYSDILFSYAVSNWKTKNAREEITKLVDYINQECKFKINKDFILKTFLFLYHKEIKFSIKSFDNGFITDKIENNWDKIKSAIITSFKLLANFGLNEKTLNSNNAVMPIVHFIYHKQLAENHVLESIHFNNTRDLIKKYILRSIILKPFGGSADTILTNVRKAFITDFDMEKEKFFGDEKMDFPLEQIEKSYRYGQHISNDFLVEVMNYRKESAEAFAVLSLLYSNLDTKNHFHKDHLHPESACKKAGIKKEKYDTLPNLQLLTGSENDSKLAKSLEDWVNEKCGDDDGREKFLDDHLIPKNVDLSLEKFEEFYEERKKLLIEKLSGTLNVKTSENN